MVWKGRIVLLVRFGLVWFDLACEEGSRESEGSWSEILKLDCGMSPRASGVASRMRGCSWCVMRGVVKRTVV